VELSPKQQAVEQLKKAGKVLILGHKKPDGDMIGSALAMAQALREMDKEVELVISDKIPEIFNFLPYLDSVKKKLDYQDGKLIRIDTTKMPVKGLKYQRRENSLDIFLDSDKNLKFEYIEIKNGTKKPDLIIIFDTPDVEGIDRVYDETPELFYEVPILNIDHHPGNEYFGAINLIDLTATSTSEILVSLLEALQYKLSSPDVATTLLTGIIADTQSFRSASTTPKSLTVAAQLLAAGARQQEIVTNLYKKKPMALLKLWGQMLSILEEDKDLSLAWVKVDLRKAEEATIGADDVLGSIDELLANTPDAKYLLVFVQESDGNVLGRIKARSDQEKELLTKVFDLRGGGLSADFRVKGLSLENAELKTLKRIHDFWQDAGEEVSRNVWDALKPAEKTAEKEDIKEPEPNKVEEKVSQKTPENNSLPQPKEPKKNADPIENALKSLSENQVEGRGFTPLKEIMEKKKKDLDMPKGNRTGHEPRLNHDIDVFDEED
jgi:bifunctional oligoribonuclease and PAP phosphatase NrnA